MKELLWKQSYLTSLIRTENSVPVRFHDELSNLFSSSQMIFTKRKFDNFLNWQFFIRLIHLSTTQRKRSAMKRSSIDCKRSVPIFIRYTIHFLRPANTHRLGEIFLFGRSPVLQGWIQLLHYKQTKTYYLLWSNPI